MVESLYIWRSVILGANAIGDGRSYLLYRCYHLLYLLNVSDTWVYDAMDERPELSSLYLDLSLAS